MSLPLLVVWTDSDVGKFDRATWAKTALTFILLTFVGVIAFRGPFVDFRGVSDYPLAFVTLPLVVYAAFVAGRRGATAACLVCSAIAVSATVQGLGPFFRGSFNASFLLLQSYLIVISTTAVILAAELNERDVKAVERMEPEDCLYDEKEFTQAILNCQRDTFILFETATGKVIRWNRAFNDITGYTDDEIAEMPAPESYFNPENLGRAKTFIQEVFDTGGGRIELDLICKDGRTVSTEYNVSVVKDTDGSPKYLISIGRDIGNRKKVESTLNAERQRFQILAENFPFGLVMIAADGTFQYTNPKFKEIFGYDQTEIRCGREWFRKAFPDPAYRRDVISGWIEEVGRIRSGERRPKVLRVICKDGTEKIIHFRTVQLDTGEHLMTCEDITDRQQAQEALFESEEMFRLLSEQSLMSVAILQDGVYKYANQAMADLVECSLHEILNWQPEEFLKRAHPEDRPLVMEQARLKQSGDPRQKTSYEFRVLAESGVTKWVEIYSKTVQFKGRNANLLTMIDVSGRKQAEAHLRQSQKMEAIGTLAGGIAHDVNNLLQIVLGQADMLLLRKGMDKKFVNSVKAIRRSALNGADLVRRILTFSRQAEPEMWPMKLSDEVRRVEELLRRTIPRMIRIEMALDDNLWMIEADPSQLEQILLNLAVNAKDAMPDGGKLLFETKNATLRDKYCQTHPEVQPGKYVLLTVSDTGHGMQTDTMARIFDPFFSTKDPGKGTGLGLSTVFGIVKKHGGHIHCYSEVGVGTSFKIYFPVAKEELPKAVMDTIEMPAGGTETLLLVDDEMSVRTLGAEMLELAGYTVSTAANGREALEIYGRNKKKIALVILDLVMPEMGGRMCLDELLKIDPKAKVLIASGFSPDGPTKNALQSGAVGFIGKPFDLKQILLAVRRCLDSPVNDLSQH